jgi:hypothetical protein
MVCAMVSTQVGVGAPHGVALFTGVDLVLLLSWAPGCWRTTTRDLKEAARSVRDG